MQDTINTTIDTCIDKNTHWNADAKDAYNHGNIASLIDIVSSYYDSLLESN